jgi:tetratricopeptide (TPR) repeat protein
MVLSSARQIPEALSLMEQAIERDPRYGSALAWAAVCCHRLVSVGQREDPAADHLKAIDYARRALGVAGDDPEILVNAALALASFGEDIDAMMALVDRALGVNPNFAHGWFTSGILRLWAGRPDIAIEHFDAARRLSPRGRIGTSLAFIAIAHLSAGASMRHRQNSSSRCRTILATRSCIVFSLPATPIWVGSTTHERSSGGCGPLPLS